MKPLTNPKHNFELTCSDDRAVNRCVERWSITTGCKDSNSFHYRDPVNKMNVTDLAGGNARSVSSLMRARRRQINCSGETLIVRVIACMNQDNKRPRSPVVQAEIRYRWPSLPLSALNNEIRTPDALAILLSEQMGFCENRALMEANGFWNDLEERFRLASTA